MKKSAGILLYRMQPRKEVCLCHPGGPFYKSKDNGVWTIPKGEFEDEDPLDAAKREFSEETGQPVSGRFIELKPVRYRDGRKMVFAWAVEGTIDTTMISSNVFDLEWPPKSGRTIQVPEVDRGDWFTMADARKKILPSLLPLLDEFGQLDL